MRFKNLRKKKMPKIVKKVKRKKMLSFRNKRKIVKRKKRRIFLKSKLKIKIKKFILRRLLKTRRNRKFLTIIKKRKNNKNEYKNSKKLIVFR